MNRDGLTAWLVTQQATIEQIILHAAQSFAAEHEGYDNFGYDLQCAQEEAYNLSKGLDLCYDRYTTPLAYSLWYQARRINVFASHFAGKLVEACTSGQPVEVFDLGAGTGCVQFCFGLTAVAFQKAGHLAPLLRIINVDSSPFMLNYLRLYLWPAALRFYPELQNIAVEYHVNAWSNNGEFHITNPWICASYLFDSSDNEDYLRQNFDDLIKTFAPAKALLLSSAQESKVRLMNRLAQTLKTKLYTLTTATNPANIFRGNLDSVTAFRKNLIARYGLKASANPVQWSDGSFTALGLERAQSSFAFDTRQRPATLEIFNPPLRIRREVELNEEQKKAARFENNPAVITGPAGCGKSIVITEKIINVLNHHRWQGPLRILVTTFNKSLLKQLRTWLTDLLVAKDKPVRQRYYQASGANNDGTGKLFTGQGFSVTIDFVHFEMLAGYVGGVAYRPFKEEVHIEKLRAIIADVRRELAIPERNMTNILTPAFLLEEYHRVIYGMQCTVNSGLQAYLDIDRTGRGKGLKEVDQRPAVWAALKKYAVWMNNEEIAGHSYLARRQLFFNKLERGEVANLFDFVFVDEFQDCTRTDFQIMNLLLHDTNRLVLAGDMAQAVHIGKSGFIPKDADSNNRKRYKLRGSYRLPFRICEAIRPLSQQLNKVSINQEETAEITPYKGAPPGSRPIFVYATDCKELAQKIVAIKRVYGVFDPKQITIMEKDQTLCQAVRQLASRVETTTILRLKGLEKEFVVWSLQAEIEYEDEVLEFAYTIMTRTNCLLIVAASNDAKAIYAPALQCLTPERLIFWDDESAANFDNVKSQTATRYDVLQN